MKIVRRDHSISPSDKSKMRRLDEMKLGACRALTTTGGCELAGGAGGISFVI
jgi:hypothetical protein